MFSGVSTCYLDLKSLLVDRAISILNLQVHDLFKCLLMHVFDWPGGCLLLNCFVVRKGFHLTGLTVPLLSNDSTAVTEPVTSLHIASHVPKYMLLQFSMFAAILAS